MRVEDILERVNEIDKIIDSFGRASIPGASEMDIDKAVIKIKGGWPATFLKEYRDYLCGLEVKDNKKG